MKLKLTFEVDVDDKEILAFWSEYPELKEYDNGYVWDCLAREAIANWEMEGLINDAHLEAVEKEGKIIKCQN